MKVLITGYAGLLGRHIARKLKNENNLIRILLHKKTVTKADFIEEANEYLWGSLEDSEVIKNAIEGVDIVIHCAWKFNPQGSNRPTNNEVIVKQLVQQCIRAGVKKFLFISSVAIYGMQGQNTNQIDEKFHVSSTSTDFIYPAEKISSEQIIASIERGNMSIGIFRPGPIFSDEKSPIKKIINLPGLKLAIGFGTGENPMPYIHVDDIAAAVKLWIDSDHDYSVYNLTTDLLQSHKDWYIAWGKKKGLKLTPIFLRPKILRSLAYFATLLKRLLKKPGDIDLTYAISAATRKLRYSNKKAMLELDWEPKITNTYKI